MGGGIGTRSRVDEILDGRTYPGAFKRCAHCSALYLFSEKKAEESGN